MLYKLGLLLCLVLVLSGCCFLIDECRNATRKIDTEYCDSASAVTVPAAN